MNSMIDVELVGYGVTVTARVQSGTTLDEVLDTLQVPGGQDEWYLIYSTGLPVRAYPELLLYAPNEVGLKFKCKAMMTDDDWNRELDEPLVEWEDCDDEEEDGDELDDEWEVPDDWPDDFEGDKPGDPFIIMMYDDDDDRNRFKLAVLTDEALLKVIGSDELIDYDEDNDIEDLEPARLGSEFGGVTVSKGNVLARDVIGRFFAFLREYVREELADQWAAEFGLSTCYEGEDKYQEAVGGLIDRFFQAFNAIAPEGHYFGHHPNEPYHLGFWSGQAPEKHGHEAVALPLDPQASSLRDAIADDLRSIVNQDIAAELQAGVARGQISQEDADAAVERIGISLPGDKPLQSDLVHMLRYGW